MTFHIVNLWKNSYSCEIFYFYEMEFAMSAEDKHFNFKQDGKSKKCFSSSFDWIKFKDFGFPDAQFILSSDTSNFNYEFLNAERPKNDQAASDELQAKILEKSIPATRRDSISNKTARSESVESDQNASMVKQKIQVKNNESSTEKKNIAKASLKRSLDVPNNKIAPQKIKRVDGPKDRTESPQEILGNMENLEEDYDGEATFDKVQTTITTLMNSISATEAGMTAYISNIFS